MIFKKKSYAKINLFLKILNQRSDHFHNLESLFSLIDLYDEIEVSKSSKLTLEFSGEFANLIDVNNNLFLTIINYFQQKFSISNNLSIKIKKNIPIGAGLGGGSSNACQFMKILNEIYQLNLNKEQLKEISLNFGSDIAFFFEEKSQIVLGRGELNFEFANIENLPIIVIYPNFNLSTKLVFNHYKKNLLAQNIDKIFYQYHNQIMVNLKSKSLNLDSFNRQFINKNNYSDNSSVIDNQIKNHDLDLIAIDQLKFLDFVKISNDLEDSAIYFAPIILEIKNQLLNHDCLIAKMSGSGSSVFAIFQTQEQSQIAYQKLKKLYPDFSIFKTKLLGSI
jgi:4-diphosphocytidyl-2-C-methyl-D-erythritol kinase